LGVNWYKKNQKTEAEPELKFITSTPLDKEQLEAVRYPYDKPLLVAAGPGSGKTRVVAERVKDLILNQGILPEKILCMTFTKAGEAAMQRRLENDPDLKKHNTIFPARSQIRTFHSLCYQLLDMKRGQTFEIQKYNDDDDEYEFHPDMLEWEKKLKDTWEKYNFTKFDNNRQSIEDFSDGVTAFKVEKRYMQDLSEYLERNKEDRSEEEFIQKLEDLLKYFKAYEQHLDQLQKKDFNDYLLETVEKLVGQFLKDQIKKYEHVIIDEFQDNNYLQFEITKKITPTGHITVVGDRNQSIYSFQGANVEIFNKFKTHYQKPKEIYLKHNYRSTQKIVALANRLLEKDPNENHHDKSVTENEQGKKIVIFEFCNTKDEYEFFKRKIISKIGEEFQEKLTRLKTLQSNTSDPALLSKYDKQIAKFEENPPKIKLSDFTILARTNKTKTNIINYLRDNGIPIHYRKSGLVIIDGPKTRSTYGDRLKYFIMEHSLNQKSHITELVEKLALYLDEEDIHYHILHSLASSFMENKSNAKIEEFVKFVETRSPQKRKTDFPKIRDGVEVATAHSVKGLEFPFVILSTSYQNHFPLKFKDREMKVPPELLRMEIKRCPKCGGKIERGLEKPECPSCDCDVEEELHNKEERRLYYVGLTRAFYELVITFPKKDREDIERSRSKFLGDLECSADEENIFYKNECEDEENSDGEDG